MGRLSALGGSGLSSYLHTLPSALNERILHNDDQPMQIPLQMVVGTSNEMPEDREELGRQDEI